MGRPQRSFSGSALWPASHSHSAALCGRGGRSALPPPHTGRSRHCLPARAHYTAYKARLLYGFDFGVNSRLWLSKMSLKFSEMNSNSAQRRPFSLGDKTKPHAFNISIHSSHSQAARIPSPPRRPAAPSQRSHPRRTAPGPARPLPPGVAVPPAGTPRPGLAVCPRPELLSSGDAPASPRPERPLPPQRSAARRPAARVRRCATAEGREECGRAAPRPVA